MNLLLRIIIIVFSAIPIFTFGQVQKHQYLSTGTWKLVWADEFDYNGLPDTLKWGYDVGGNGWGNNESQYYTYADTANAIVKDGLLTITARHEGYKSGKYTSVRLTTKNKYGLKYGRIEVRAKLPKGRGMWPAIWMLPVYGLTAERLILWSMWGTRPIVFTVASILESSITCKIPKRHRACMSPIYIRLFMSSAWSGSRGTLVSLLMVINT